MTQQMQLRRSICTHTTPTYLANTVSKRQKRSTATSVAAAPGAAAAASPVVFPHSDTVSVDGRDVHYRQIIDMLAPAVTPERLEKMQQVRIGFGRGRRHLIVIWLNSV
jgi:hypothetical protein